MRVNLSIGGHEVDAYWPDVRLVVEIDGGAHRTRHAFQEDRSRDRHLATLGIQVARVTSADLAHDLELARGLMLIRQGRRRARSR